MNIEQFLQKLSYGPLSDLAMSGDGSGLVNEKDIPKMMMGANSALNTIYARFRLRKKAIMIEAVEGISTYHLRREFALTSDSDEEHKYLVDTATHPFMDDVMQVVEVLDSCHKALPFNDRNQELSWFQVDYDSLSMDYARTGDLFIVNYIAYPEELPLLPDETEMDKEIRIPRALEMALLNYAGYMVYNNLNIEHAQAKAAALMGLYEQEAQKVEALNLFNTSEEPTNIKPLIGGWVR